LRTAISSVKRVLRAQGARFVGRRYDPRTHGLYDRARELPVSRAQSIYDPRVFGRYDLSTHRVVRKDVEDDGLFSLDLDARMADAVQHTALGDTPVVRDRYDLALALLEPGTGICLDACTPFVDPGVRARVEGLGYTYRPVDITGDGAVVERQDLTQMTLATDSVACILSLDTLEHIDAYDVALRELNRVARPGAPLVVHVPCYFGDRSASVPIASGIDPWGHVRYFAARELAGRVIDAGFVLLRLSLHLDYGAALVVAAKPWRPTAAPEPH
jgi:SAM-dependent methyltransferase